MREAGGDIGGKIGVVAGLGRADEDGAVTVWMRWGKGLVHEMLPVFFSSFLCLPSILTRPVGFWGQER